MVSSGSVGDERVPPKLLPLQIQITEASGQLIEPLLAATRSVHPHLFSHVRAHAAEGAVIRAWAGPGRAQVLRKHLAASENT